LNFWSTSIVARACPFSSFTPVMSPMRTPDTRTVWPWPGATALASTISALRVNGVLSMNGNRTRTWCRM